jgi:tetratricopeptide (TPR) repeat protein
MQDRGAEGLAMYRRALDIFLREVGPRHEMTLWSQIGVASGLDATGQRAEAHARLLRIIEDARAALGPDHQTLALALETAGKVELGLHDYRAARAHVQSSFAMYRRVIGPEFAGREALRLLGEADLGVGRAASALDHLDQARQKVTPSVPPSEVAWLDGLLGRALYESGRDRARGLQLVAAAWRVLARDDHARARRAELAGWMRAHHVPGPRGGPGRPRVRAPRRTRRCRCSGRAGAPR